MARPDKAAAVAELAGEFRESNGAVLTEYRGLSVAALNELRRGLGQTARFRIVKNTLTKIAVKDAEIDEEVSDLLEGPSAIAFVHGDVVEAAKGLRDFSKQNSALVIKGGVIDGKTMDAEQITKLADLESREVLLAKMAGALKDEFDVVLESAGDKKIQVIKGSARGRQQGERGQGQGVPRGRRRHRHPQVVSRGPQKPAGLLHAAALPLREGRPCSCLHGPLNALEGPRVPYAVNGRVRGRPGPMVCQAWSGRSGGRRGSACANCPLGAIISRPGILDGVRAECLPVARGGTLRDVCWLTIPLLGPGAGALVQSHGTRRETDLGRGVRG